jgi:accessory gene regulator protein AgrB
MSLMSECLSLSSLLEGLSLKSVVFQFEDKPFKNNKVAAPNSKDIKKSSEI